MVGRENPDGTISIEWKWSTKTVGAALVFLGSLLATAAVQVFHTGQFIEDITVAIKAHEKELGKIEHDMQALIDNQKAFDAKIDGITVRIAEEERRGVIRGDSIDYLESAMNKQKFSNPLGNSSRKRN